MLMLCGQLYIKAVISDSMTPFKPKFQFRSNQYPTLLMKDLQHLFTYLSYRTKNKHYLFAHTLSRVQLELNQAATLILRQSLLVTMLPLRTSSLAIYIVSEVKIKSSHYQSWYHCVLYL